MKLTAPEFLIPLCFLDRAYAEIIYLFIFTSISSSKHKLTHNDRGTLQDVHQRNEATVMAVCVFFFNVHSSAVERGGKIRSR